MIGKVDENKIFEYRNNDDLLKAFDVHASKYDDSNITIAVNSEDKIKFIIADGKFLVEPNEYDLEEEKTYYLIFINSGRTKIADLNLPDKDEELPSKYIYETKHRFKFFNRPYPKEID